MKNIIKTLVVVMVIVLMLAVFTACNQDPEPTTPACEHSGGTATCEQKAVCEKCQQPYGELAEHTIVTQSGKPATCESAGSTEGKYCSECFEVLEVQEEIKALGHVDAENDGNHVCDNEGCGKEGITECAAGEKSHNCAECSKPMTECKAAEGSHKCAICDAVKSECKAADNSHTCATCGKVWSTCEAAENSHTCATCGKVWSTCEAAANSHNCATCGKELTTCEAAVNSHNCAVCGKQWSNHDYENACDTDCGICGETREPSHTEVILEAKAPTCTDTGLTEGKKCSVCGTIIKAQERVSANGHTEETVAGKAATCTESGLTDGTKCSVCGTVTVEQTTIDALGHKDENGDYECDACGTDLCTKHVAAEAVEENRVESTCTVAGSYESVVKCSKCGEEISRETVTLELADHTEEVISAVEPTCTETGLTAGVKCSVCGETIKAQTTVNAYGHNETEIPGKAATCENTGLEAGKTCTVCGVTTVEQVEIPALGHNYGNVAYEWVTDNSNVTLKATKVCANDETHVISDTSAVSTITLSVTSTKATYTFTVSEDETYTYEIDVTLVDNIATIYAPAVTGRVASHDYVKFPFYDTTATHTFTIYYSEVDVWDGTSVSESLSGSGTEEDPYLIQSAADLAYVKDTVNALATGKWAFEGVYMKLTKSIDVNGTNFMIGNYVSGGRRGFAAYFDGNNCTIRGLNNSESFIGSLEAGGWVKNLSVYGKVNRDAAYIGGLCGIVFTGASVDNVTSYVDLTAPGAVGGITGYTYGTTISVTNCVNYGSINSTAWKTGGIVGWNKGEIKNCINFGNIVAKGGYAGGILGFSKESNNSSTPLGTATNCINYGNLTANDTVGKIGGIAGWANTVTDCDNYGTITTITGASYVGNVCGYYKTSCTNPGEYGNVVYVDAIE